MSGIKSKIYDINHQLSKEIYKVIFIQESWFNSNWHRIRTIKLYALYATIERILIQTKLMAEEYYADP